MDTAKAKALYIQGSFTPLKILNCNMRTKVLSNSEPWHSAYLNFSSDPRSQANYKLSGPSSVLTRDRNDSPTGLAQIIQDDRAAINLALRYIVTKDETYALASRNILDEWSSTLKVVNGSDRQLGARLSGVNLVNAAEIPRYEWAGWSAANITRFEDMIANLFVPTASGGWGTTGEKAMISYAVFLNNRTLYDEALARYSTGEYGSTCGSLPFMIAPTGQYVESGRDQGHTQLSLGNMAKLAQVAFSQGDDSVYDLLNKRLMVGYEYTSEFLMTDNTLPYNTSWVCCGCANLGWKGISELERGQWRPIHEIAYGYYAQKKGNDMPYTKMLLEAQGLETTNPSSASNDNAEWGTLRFRRSQDL
ncbi:chondroitin AC/alginate lyase [Fusarium solani]|uniref:Chondroitin AC/alginate lyase n=1 Tax=Fusarium solani TaxID=169388 RepID=A0A9P9G553_FUSSL|nr:chondroitin AC/alginate lyase [Fusarium solani]KAH7231579.1 chondroitin AC/alginate lyase [Fusarium solani]